MEKLEKSIESRNPLSENDINDFLKLRGDETVECSKIVSDLKKVTLDDGIMKLLVKKE